MTNSSTCTNSVCTTYAWDDKILTSEALVELMKRIERPDPAKTLQIILANKVTMDRLLADWPKVAYQRGLFGEIDLTIFKFLTDGTVALRFADGHFEYFNMDEDTEKEAGHAGL